jgi:hypothetical protein
MTLVVPVTRAPWIAALLLSLTLGCYRSHELGEPPGPRADAGVDAFSELPMDAGRDAGTRMRRDAAAADAGPVEPVLVGVRRSGDDVRVERMGPGGVETITDLPLPLGQPRVLPSPLGQWINVSVRPPDEDPAPAFQRLALVDADGHRIPLEWPAEELGRCQEGAAEMERHWVGEDAFLVTCFVPMPGASDELRRRYLVHTDGRVTPLPLPSCTLDQWSTRYGALLMRCDSSVILVDPDGLTVAEYPAIPQRAQWLGFVAHDAIVGVLDGVIHRWHEDGRVDIGVLLPRARVRPSVHPVGGDLMSIVTHARGVRVFDPWTGAGRDDEQCTRWSDAWSYAVGTPWSPRAGVSAVTCRAGVTHVDFDTGERQVVTEPPGRNTISTPSFNRDGSELLLDHLEPDGRPRFQIFDVATGRLREAWPGVVPEHIAWLEPAPLG